MNRFYTEMLKGIKNQISELLLIVESTKIHGYYTSKATYSEFQMV